MTDATKRPDTTAKRPATFWITLAVFAAVVFVYVVLVTRPGEGPKGDEGPAIGRRLEFLRLEGLTGQSQASISLEDLQGRVTVLNYWGTWCPPCIQEFPEIVALAEKFADADDFRLYAVSCGGEGRDANLDELRAETTTFLDSRSATLPTYADRNADSRLALVGMLGAPNMSYPMTIVLDRAGTVRGFWEGYHPNAVRAMEKLVATLLEELPPAPMP